MKEKFKGYYRLTNKQITKIWADGFISLDTNVLFNLYRYSEDTRKELFDKIEIYSDQLWLPHHVAYEFHKNRIGVITDQIKTYEDTIKGFEKLENDIVKNLKSPHLTSSIQKKFEKTHSEVKKDLEKKIKFFSNLLSNDPILTKVTKLFKSKIGDELSKEEIAKIEKEGEERYKKKIPPGFKDGAKEDNKFGDLVIWKQLLQKAKQSNKSFIFIVDDVKEDWWLRPQGKTISPRPELCQELYLDSKQSFHMYTPDRFLEYASQGNDANIKAIEEVRDIHENIYTHNRYWTLADSIIPANPLINPAVNVYSIPSNNYLYGQGITGSIYGNANPNIVPSIYGNLNPFLASNMITPNLYQTNPVQLVTRKIAEDDQEKKSQMDDKQ